MIPIFTVLKDGEFLTKDVMRGVIDQSVDCCLVPITSKGKKGYSESNRCRNVLRALEQCRSDYFILMDSDVVLGNKSMIQEMLDDRANFSREIISVCTKGEQVRTCSYIPHGLMMVKGYKLREFKEQMKKKPEGEGKEFCLICRFFNQNMNLDQTITLQNEKIHEIKREVAA